MTSILTGFLGPKFRFFWKMVQSGRNLVDMGNHGRWLRLSSRELRKNSITCSKLKKTSNIAIFELGDRQLGLCLGDIGADLHWLFSRFYMSRTWAFHIYISNLPTQPATLTKLNICENFGSQKSKNPGKSASGGQRLTDRGFWRYVSCSLES